MIRSSIVIALCLLTACVETGDVDVSQTVPQNSGSDFTSVPLPNSIDARPELPSDIEFVNLLNNIRIDNGVGLVAFDARLAGAAQYHADDMVARDYTAHESPEGQTAGDRATAAGYIWRNIGENIGQGQTSVDQIFDGWTNSPGHHANNISPNFDDFGLATAGSGADTRWVLVLGRE